MPEARWREMTPLGDRVLVETIKPKTTRSGIHLPDQIERPETARVLAVGPGRITSKGVLIPIAVEVDDIVVFHRHSGTYVGGLDEDNLIVFREQDLLATVPELEDEQ